MSLSPLTTSAGLAATAAAFARWRDATPLGARIPEELWSRALELASIHGVGRVARTLRLDYARLKRRVTEARVAPVSPPASPGLCRAHRGSALERADMRAGPGRCARAVLAHRVDAPARQ